MHAVAAICLGACAGALLRWQLGLWLNHAGAWLPWGTLAANLVGGYLVGLADRCCPADTGALRRCKCSRYRPVSLRFAPCIASRLDCPSPPISMFQPTRIFFDTEEDT
ncbi:hypothetical protein MASR1M50_30110 [Burkholderiales bacterium]